MIQITGMKNFMLATISMLLMTSCHGQKKGQETTNNRQLAMNNEHSGSSVTTNKEQNIIPAAERINVYLPLIKGKRIGIFANQTSTVGNSHLVDTLRKLGVNIKVIFGPEHGFRGTADAGEKIGNYTDQKTGIPVVSLYGSKRRPSAEDVKDEIGRAHV